MPKTKTRPTATVSVLRPRRDVERLEQFAPIRVEYNKHADDVTRAVVDSYKFAYDTVRDDLHSMADEAAAAKHSGLALSDRQITRLARVDRSLSAISGQISDLNSIPTVKVHGVLGGALRHRVDRMVETSHLLVGTDLSYTTPSNGALEGIILRSIDQIESSSRRLSAKQAVQLRAGLIRGLARGENPMVTAREIFKNTSNAFLGGLPRATTLARTEILDAGRHADRLAYVESEFVVGWKWLAVLDSRTCPTCWAMHNTFHEKTEQQFAHQNCRCTTVPVLEDDDDSDVDLGDAEQTFWGLPREDQLSIMGPGRLKALEGGAPWSSLTYLGQNEGWRPSQKVTRVSDLKGLAELHVARSPGDVIDIPGQTNASVLAQTFRDGGMTIRTMDGSQPDGGYVVALGNDFTEAIDARDFFDAKVGPGKVAAFMRAHEDLLDAEGGHLGIWYDEKNGKVVLDPVKILDDRDAAVALGREKDQVAIFDLNTFSEIQTGGSGGYLPQAIGSDDIGREVTVSRDGSSVTGTVTVSAEWGIRLRLANGDEINATPGQYKFTDKPRDRTLDRARETQEIAETSPLRSDGVDVSYRGLDPKVARAYDGALVDNAKTWGHTPFSVSTDHLRDGRYAVTSTRNTDVDNADRRVSRLRFNTDFGDPDYLTERLRSAESIGHFHHGVAGDGPGFIATHEYGHVLDWWLLGPEGSKDRDGTVMRAVDDVLGRGGKSYGLWESLDGDDGRDFLSSILSSSNVQGAIRKDLSGYASSSVGEMIAEAYAVHSRFGTGRSIVADSVYLSMVKAYRRQRGGLPPGVSADDVESLERRFR